MSMWGRKEENEPSAKPAAPQPEPMPSKPEPVRVAPSGSDDRRAQIGKSLRMKGEITGSEDLLIDGEVEGTVELRGNNLTIGPNGNVKANVTARCIAVMGRLEGNVQAGEKIEIQKTGSLEGDIITARIVIEDGAIFRGSIDIVKPGQERQGGEKPGQPAARAGAKPDAASRAPEPKAATTEPRKS